MKIGDLVVITSIPSTLPDGMGTRELFAKCLGRTFAIVGFQDGFVELDVGEVLGEPSYMHSIWIEPFHLAPSDSKGTTPKFKRDQ
jgi:hypothetical protein